ncbi:hypothetical protein [Maridesulfovibrio ferrireducens]|uniref:hypothetical protein n=1 Tax=Maridesulfovibrio ferrireducens TaxID=246191 RepID=UPI001A3396FC|nr:hypothetical protein [Maridesulfovibrio ferrireducens]MBI9111317.1 hypothetical protein [Maridesulfovibrio ferrireducens]
MFVKKTSVLIFVLAVSLLWCSAARAFFPSDTAIDEALYKKYGALTSYEAVITFPSEPETTLTILRGDNHWKQTFECNTGGNGTITAKSVGQYFKTEAQCPVEGNLPFSLLQLWIPDDPTSEWISLGVTNSSRSYGFTDDSPAFVFGAEPGDDSSPQVFFDNENFAPLKIVLGSSKAITFGTYTKFAGFILPHSGSLIVEEETVDFKIEWRGVRRKISPAVFSAAAIKKDAGCGKASGHVFDVLKKCLSLKP